MKKTIRIIAKTLAVVLMILLIIYLFILYWPGIGRLPNSEKKASYEEKTDMYYNGQFHNTAEPELGGEENEKSDLAVPDKTVPIQKRESIKNAVSGEVKITWLGHSSSLIQMGDINILLDPILTKYASPVNFVGKKRFSEIPIEPENLPDIDIVFISHGDYDHLDYTTIKKLDGKTKNYIVPLGLESFLEGWGISKDKITTLGWWDETDVAGLHFAFTESQHYCVRNPIGFNTTWWGGIVIKDEKYSIYYTGDGGYGSFFKKVYESYGAMDLILTDTGQYDPAWAWCHMTPAEALKAAEEVHAKYWIPVHWGAYTLSNHAWNEPPEMAMAEAQNSDVNVIIPKIGETVELEQLSNYINTRWWE